MAVTPYSELRRTTRIPLVESLPLRAPLALHIETTNRCNFKCVMCPVGFPDWEEKVGGITKIPFADIERLYTDLLAMGGSTKVIRYYGEGEPMLDKDLGRSIALAHALGVTQRTELTSNGSALTEATGRELISSGLTHLRISIYGVTEAQQASVTRSKVSAERIRKNVEAFKALRESMASNTPFIYAKMIDNGNHEDTQRFLERYRPITDEAVVEPPMDWDSLDGRDLVHQANPTAAKADKVWGRRDAPRRVCPYPFYSLVIKANGDVVACCVDWSKSTKVGNIHETSFPAIWSGRQLRDFRLMHLEGRRDENKACKDCWFFEAVPDDLDGVAPEEFGRIVG